MAVWIIIPAYNEAKRIKATLDDYGSLASRTGEEIRIIVVSESRDRTNSIVSNYSKKHHNVTLITSKARLGKGGAVRKGFEMACKKANKKDIVGFVDADDAIESAESLKLIRHLEKPGISGAIGSRYMRESKIKGDIPLKRIIPSRIYNLLVRVLFGLKYKDTQCGSKFFKKTALCSVVGKMVLSDMSFDVNILYALWNKGYRVEEVPIVYDATSPDTTVVLGWQMVQMFVTIVGYRISITRIGKSIPVTLKSKVYGIFRK